MSPLDCVVGYACVLELPALNCRGSCFHLIIRLPEVISVTIAYHVNTKRLDNIKMPLDERGNRLYLVLILSS